MKMIDLKRVKQKNEKKDDTVAPSDLSQYDERPYCLRFTLEKPELEKLGLTPQSFGGMKPVTAMMEIEPITIRDIEQKKGDWDGGNQSVEFQITAINIEGVKGSKFKDYNDAQEEGPGGREVK